MFRRSCIASAALLLVATTVAACGQSEDITASPPTTAATLAQEPTATPATAAPEAPAATEPGLHLLDAGAEPRRELRLELPVGATERAHIDVEMSQTMGGAPALVLGIGMEMDVSVTEATEEGYAFDFTYGGADVRSDALPAEILSAMQEGMSTVERMQGTMRLSRNGEPQGGGLEPPAGVDPAVSQQLGDLSSQMQQVSGAFPPEPVGPGARWQNVYDEENNGMTVRQVVTYTLRSLEGDAYVLDVEMRQSAGPQTLADGSSLESLSSTGTGTLRGSLTALMPTEGSTSSTTEMVLQAPSLGTQTQVIDVQVVVRRQ